MAMATDGPDARLPSGDGFPEGADISDKGRYRGNTADNLFHRLEQPATATNMHAVLLLSRRSQVLYTGH
jgi:hypothetical protein